MKFAELYEKTMKEDENGVKVKMTEGKVASEKDLKAYAMTLAKAAFGDKTDEKKVDGIVKHAIEMSDGDWGKAAGIVTGSFNS